MPISVPARKLRDYLLNPDHSENCGKAKFFLAGGFAIEEIVVFAGALEAHLQNSPHARREETKFGLRLIIEAPLSVPDGRTPLVRSIWMIEENSLSANFVTAYPIDSCHPWEANNPFFTGGAAGGPL